MWYDFITFTDRKISTRRPDIVYMDKGSGSTRLLDVPCVMDVIDRHVIDD